MSRGTLLALILTLAATAAACGDAKLYPYDRPMGGTVNCPDTIEGYATLGDADGGVPQGTIGGIASQTPPTTVNNLTDFITAVQDPQPRVIFLDGMLAPTDTIKMTLNRDVPNGNKTIIGVGANSGLTGAGLDLGYSYNVILRNLKISNVSIGEGDAITILASDHIWVDHCDLSSDRNDTTTGYDGLVDITHGSSNVTISWTQFHDHKDTTLVGHSSDVTQMIEDSALSVTYHHNLFLRVNSGPRVRFGKAHVYSNHFEDVTSFGVVSESFAIVIVDHNWFADLNLPIATTYSDPNPGTMTEMSNRFPPGFVVDIARPVDPQPVPYIYPDDSADGVSAIVERCAGTGKLPFE